MKVQEQQKLRAKANDLRGLVNIKDYLCNDGPSRGMRAIDLKNGMGIDMTVFADRGMDIPALNFHGVNIGLNNKVALRSPYLFQEDGARGFLRQFNGGMMSTCGMTYAGAPEEENGEKLGLHGVSNNLPAENVGAWEDSEDGEVVLRVRGQVRQARAFAECIRNTRMITLHTERNLVEIHDKIENIGYSETPLMMIYHINFGYPMLDAGAKVYCTGRNVVGRTPFAQDNLDTWNVMEEPEEGRDEQCYFVTDFPQRDAFAMLHNENLGYAAAVHFDAEQLPVFCEWKCMCAGDYALGLEPTTSNVLGLHEARESGLLYTLKPGEKKEWTVAIELLDDPDCIQAMIRKASV